MSFLAITGIMTRYGYEKNTVHYPFFVFSSGSPLSTAEVDSSTPL
jgi:hypothetical protein